MGSFPSKSCWLKSYIARMSRHLATDSLLFRTIICFLFMYDLLNTGLILGVKFLLIVLLSLFYFTSMVSFTLRITFLHRG